MVEINVEILTGKSEAHLATSGLWAGVLHASVVAPFEALRAAAAEAGFDLSIVSGYRSFERQLAIWNGKVRGERAVLDDAQTPIILERLSKAEQMHAILRWSALPGASRHHWGTDFDIVDAEALKLAKQPSGLPYRLKLTAEETEPGGIFAEMYTWLESYLPKTDFYRPYGLDRGGVGPEPWHLSYTPVADHFAKAQNSESIVTALAGSGMELEALVSAHIDELFTRYVRVPSKK